MKTASRKHFALGGVLGATIVLGAGLFVAPASLAFPVQNADEERPDGIEVIRKYVEVTGGEEAYKKATSRVTKAKFAMPAAGLNADMTIYQEAPNKMATSLDLGQFGTQKTATDGKDAWEISSMSGPRLLTAEEAASMTRQAAFDVQTNPEKYYTSIENLGAEEFEGERAWKLELTPEDGEKTTQFYSVESGLLLGQVSKEVTQMGEVESKVIMSDYRDAGDLKMPHKLTIQMPALGMTQTLLITSIEHNTEIDPKVFTMPDEIKELKEQQNGGGDTDDSGDGAGTGG